MGTAKYAIAPSGDIMLASELESNLTTTRVNVTTESGMNVYDKDSLPKATYEVYPSGLVRIPQTRSTNYTNPGGNPFGNTNNRGPFGNSNNKGPFGGDFNQGFEDEAFENNFQDFFNEQKHHYEEQCRQEGRQPHKVTQEDLDTIMKAHKSVYKKRIKGLNGEYVDKDKGTYYNWKRERIEDDYKNDVKDATREFFNNHR